MVTPALFYIPDCCLKLKVHISVVFRHLPFFFLSFQVLIDWINDVLVEERIIVKQLEEDLYDGQVLQKLLGEFT